MSDVEVAPPLGLVPEATTPKDALNKKLHRDLTDHMLEQRGSINACLNLMVISKCLEHIGDQAASIAEEVVFLYEAQDIRHTGKGEG